MIIVFTDIDGTLLARKSHSFEPVREYIDSLQDFATIILATSKTLRETLLIQEELGISAPCITENGGVIFVPFSWETHRENSLLQWESHEQGWYACTGKKHAELCAFLSSSLYKGEIRLFSQMSDTELTERTGLQGIRLIAARERYASEPFICINKDVVHMVEKDAENVGMAIQRGGMFYHCMHKGQDKAEGVKELLHMLTKRGAEFHTIALGDAPNDFAMLRMVEYPVLIPHQGHPYAIDMPNVRIAPATAPKGWIHAMKEILHEISLRDKRKE